MVRKLIDDQNEKAIETFTRMTNKDDVNEFKDKFKSRYQSDIETLTDEFSGTSENDSTIPPADVFLEELYEENRRQIEN